MKKKETQKSMIKINVNRLKGLIAEHNKTYADVAQAIGKNRDTFTRRIKSQGLDFTVAEIQKMADFIPLTYEEITDVFFNDSRKEN